MTLEEQGDRMLEPAHPGDLPGKAIGYHCGWPECDCADVGKGGCGCDDDGTISHREWDRPQWKDGAG